MLMAKPHAYIGVLNWEMQGGNNSFNTSMASFSFIKEGVAVLPTKLMIVKYENHVSSSYLLLFGVDSITYE